MKQSYSFYWLLLPFAVLIALGVSLFYERSGMEYEISYPPIQMLPYANVEVENYFDDKPVDTLVLFDSAGFAGTEHFNTVLDTLDSMRVKYDTYDINSGDSFSLDQYKIIVISFLEIEKLKSKLFNMVDWVEGGGKVLFSIRPDPSLYFSSIYRKLGIVSKSDGLIDVNGVLFTTDLIPGANGRSFGTDFIFSNSFLVRLEDKCIVHMTSADVYHIPLLWECNFGNGRFVFINSDQFNNKISRGIIGSAYSLLEDIFIYPVINSSVMFIEDFPGPITEGSLDLIEEQFGRDVQSFLINVWWVDLQQISRKYGIKYTGAMVETYNDNVIPPFTKQPEIERHQYFGGLVFDNEGEIGLLGYNHVPLCLETESANQQFDYPGWPSNEAMELAVFEIYSFGKELFPDNKFATYIPPSNILCPSARKWLPMVLPDLQVISGFYLPDKTGSIYEQEFSEASDGIVNLPRVSIGYDPSTYMRWAAINELGLHYVSSHSISPNDVLSDAETTQNGWVYLQSKFEEFVKILVETTPGLRSMTAREGAMAVQRYARLAIREEMKNGKYEIFLGNFYDEAWLMLRSQQEPTGIEGGEITKVTTNLYLIKALKSKLVIEFAE